MWGAALSLLPGVLGAGKGIFDMFSNGNNRNPAKEANKYLDQIPGQTNQYYQPYIDRGREAGNDLTQRYGQMLNNPGDLYNQLGAGYKESPGYQTRLKAGLQAATNAQAAGGMEGSLQHQQYAAERANDIQGKDFEDYLNHVLGLYGAGLQGEQGQDERGYNAGTDYGNILSNVTGQKAKNAYEDANAENTRNGQNWSNIFGGIGSGVSGYNSYQNHQDILKLLGR